jgi:hypothetical protein
LCRNLGQTCAKDLRKKIKQISTPASALAKGAALALAGGKYSEAL